MSKIGQLIDRYYNLREGKRNLREQEKKINEEMDKVNDEILSLMEIEELTSAAGDLATAHRKVDVYPRVVDKEAFVGWLYTNKKFEFFHSKVNQAPVREMLENENKIPDGIETYNKSTILLRKK